MTFSVTLPSSKAATPRRFTWFPLGAALLLALHNPFGTPAARGQGLVGPSTANYVPGMEYEIGGILVTGADHLDPSVIQLLSGLTAGDRLTLPGEKVTNAIKTLWNQKLFDNVQIYVHERQGDIVFLTIALQPLPKLSKFYFTGLTKPQQDAVRELIQLQRGAVVSENLKVTAANKIIKRYLEKGYPDCRVNVVQAVDSTATDRVTLGFDVNLGVRLRIASIDFVGNPSYPDAKLRSKFKETHQHAAWNIFQSSKLLADKYADDQRKLIGFYNTKGFRDARVVRDSSYRTTEGLHLKIFLEEGKPHFYRNISFVGNAEYPTDVLESILRIQKGERYDAKRLYERVNGDPNSNDIASLYLNNGYLFSNVMPVETRV